MRAQKDLSSGSPELDSFFFDFFSFLSGEGNRLYGMPSERGRPKKPDDEELSSSRRRPKKPDDEEASAGADEADDDEAATGADEKDVVGRGAKCGGVVREGTPDRSLLKRWVSTDGSPPYFFGAASCFDGFDGLLPYRDALLNDDDGPDALLR